MQHKFGLFTPECGGSGKLPIHLVALLYESEGAHLLSYGVSATRRPSDCTMQPLTKLVNYIYNTRILKYCRWFGLPLIVIFPRAAREPAHNNGCFPLP